MRNARWGGGLAAWVAVALAGMAQAKAEDLKVAVAPLEVHASAGTLADTAKEVRRTLAKRLDDEEGLAAALPERGDTTREPLSVAALQRVARETSARYVLYGSLTQLGGTFSLDARLYDTRGGKARAAFFREGAGREDLLAKLQGLAGEVRTALVRVETPPQASPVADTAPSQVSAATAETSSKGDKARGGPAKSLGLRVGDNKKPIAITSDSLEAINKANTVVFRGNVEARQADLRIYCDVMTVLYSPDGKGIVRIVADRHVRIIHDPAPKAGQKSEKITANCNRGVYYNDQGKIVLTGNPVVKRGSDTVRGDEITVYFEENRFTVRQAQVTITPEGVKTLGGPGGGATGSPARGN
jgi:lipopolysaccharide export system protein LptA